MLGLTPTRRWALAALPSLASCAAWPRAASYEASQHRAAAPFAHGVASGGPRADSVVIWTRAAASTDPVAVRWQVAEDAAFAHPVREGVASAEAAHDWTVKVDVSGLAPGRAYFYRFAVGEALSPIGRTRTLPQGHVERVRLAVVSCANHALGHFNVYDLIAREPGFDAVIHLGDYIYEYGPGGYEGAADELPHRLHAPAHEIRSLADYRTRYAQYRTDASLQAMHAAHPTIPVWDDHEIANNAWRNGAPSHDAGAHGPWSARRAAALQAYYEWMPVREPAQGAARDERFGKFRFGDLATLCLLETRLTARTRTFDFADLAAVDTPERAKAFMRDVVHDDARALLGAGQLSQLSAAFADAGAARQAWVLLANQTLMANVVTPDLSRHLTPELEARLRAEWPGADGFLNASRFGLPLALDAWGGYPAARERLFAAARDAEAPALVVLTGDTHSWWANDLRDANGAAVGVEFGAASVTSPSAFGPRMLGERGRDFALLLNRANRDVRYVSGQTHGYVDLELTHARGAATFVAVDNIASPSYRAFPQARFALMPQPGGAPRLARPRHLSLLERLLF